MAAGFDEDDAALALQRCDDDPHAAIALLVAEEAEDESDSQDDDSTAELESTIRLRSIVQAPRSYSVASQAASSSRDRLQFSGYEDGLRQHGAWSERRWRRIPETTVDANPSFEAVIQLEVGAISASVCDGMGGEHNLVSQEPRADFVSSIEANGTLKQEWFSRESKLTGPEQCFDNNDAVRVAEADVATRKMPVQRRWGQTR
jgi:hypothetical protein